MNERLIAQVAETALYLLIPAFDHLARERPAYLRSNLSAALQALRDAGYEHEAELFARLLEPRNETTLVALNQWIQEPLDENRQAHLHERLRRTLSLHPDFTQELAQLLEADMAQEQADGGSKGIELDNDDTLSVAPPAQDTRAQFVNFTIHDITEAWMGEERELEWHEGFLRDNVYRLTVSIESAQDERFSGEGAQPEIERPEEAADVPLYVAAFSRQPDLVRVAGEPLSRLIWPPSGPSRENATFTLEAVATGTAILDVYFYHKTNLLYTASFSMIVAPQGHQWDKNVDRSPLGWRYQADENALRSRLFRRFDFMDKMAPRALNLAIQKGDRQDEYLLTAFLGRAELPARVHLTEDELNSHVLEMREAMDRLRREPYLVGGAGYTATGDYTGDFVAPESRYDKSGRALSVTEAHDIRQHFKQFLKEMAYLGSKFWDNLFRSESAQLLRQALTDGDSLQEGDIIQIWIDEEAAGFVYPWSWLYTDTVDPDKRFNPELDRFWGYRYVIEQMPQYEELSRRRPPEPEIVAPPLDVRVGVYNFAGATEHQRDYFAGRRGEQLSVEIWDSDKEWESYLENCHSQILYFFSHGHTAKPVSRAGQQFYDMVASQRQWLAQEPEDAPDWWASYRQAALAQLDELEEEKQLLSETYIKLQKGNLLLRELYGIDLSSCQPLVFLNMCESAQVYPNISDSLIDLFLRKGARGVIGTEIPMLSSFADLFARNFFDLILSETEESSRPQSVGRALWKIRRQYLDKENPLGFAFTLFGDATVRLSHALQPEDKDKSVEE